MKRTIFIFLLVALLLVRLLPLMPVSAETTHIPHEDPALARPSVDAFSLLLYCGDVLALLQSGDYEDMTGLLEQLKYTDLPEDLKYIMSRFGELAAELAGKLDSTGKLLDEISLLISQEQIDQIPPKFAEAEGLLENVASLLSDLEVAIDTLIAKLGLSSLPAADKAIEARARLNEMAARMRQLEEEYRRLLQSLQAKVWMIQEVEPTEVDLHASPVIVLVGDPLTVSGQLVSTKDVTHPEPLPNKTLTIFLDGNRVATSTTDDSGQYQVILSMSSQHVPSVTLQASYMPAGDDMSKYLSSMSDNIVVEVRFYSPALTLNLSDTQPWVGDSVTVSGELTSPDEGGAGLPGRDVEILLDGKVVDRVSTGAGGSYLKHVVMMPYEYVVSRKVQARYVAVGDEYGPCLSLPVGVEVRFYATALSLNLSTTQSWVGDSVTVSVVLTSPDEEGVGLPGRDIEILFDGDAATTATTGSDGSYSGGVAIPYEYVASRTIQARYVAVGDKYEPCSSLPVEVDILFYHTQLEIEVPEQAYPGLPLKVSGKISPEAGAPAVERTVKLFLGDSFLGTFSPSQDVFELETVLDAETALGEQSVVVEVEAEGHYTAASETKGLLVMKGLPEIEIRGLAYIVPLKDVHIKGHVISALPLETTIVNVELRGISTAVLVSSDGEFEAVLRLPLESLAMGRQKVSVKTLSVESWHLSAEEVKAVLVIDTINVGLVSVAFVPLAILAFMRRRARPGEPEVAISDSLPEGHVGVALGIGGSGEGIQDRVLHAYTQAVGVVEAATKTLMAPHMTLREYLTAVVTKVGKAAEAFTELTALAERDLYSLGVLDSGGVLRAEELCLKVKELLLG